MDEGAARWDGNRGVGELLLLLRSSLLAVACPTWERSAGGSAGCSPSPLPSALCAFPLCHRLSAPLRSFPLLCSCRPAALYCPRYRSILRCSLSYRLTPVASAMSHHELPYQASDVAASAAYAHPSSAHTQPDDDELAALRGDTHHTSSTERALSPAQARARAQRSPHANPEDHAYAQLWRVVYSASLSWDKKLRRTHDLLALLGLLNFAVVVALFQSCFNQRTLHFKLDAADCGAYIPLQIAGGVLYAGFIVTLCYYYFLKSGFKAMLSLYPTRSSAFLHSGLLHRFAMEVALSLVQPVPLLGLVMDLSHAQWLVILALLAKLYLLVRVLRDHSEVYQQRMFLKQGTKFDTNFFEMDLLTVAKTYAYTYTLWVTAVGCTLNALFMAYLLHSQSFTLSAFPASIVSCSECLRCCLVPVLLVSQSASVSYGFPCPLTSALYLVASSTWPVRCRSPAVPTCTSTSGAADSSERLRRHCCRMELEWNIFSRPIFPCSIASIS